MNDESNIIINPEPEFYIEIESLNDLCQKLNLDIYKKYSPKMDDFEWNYDGNNVESEIEKITIERLNIIKSKNTIPLTEQSSFYKLFLGQNIEEVKKIYEELYKKINENYDLKYWSIESNENDAYLYIGFSDNKECYEFSYFYFEDCVIPIDFIKMECSLKQFKKNITTS